MLAKSILFIVIALVFVIQSVDSTKAKSNNNSNENSNNNSNDYDKILPFGRIKIVEDEIFFTLLTDQWHKLLSIDSIGSDAIIKFAKNNYGLSTCDYSIECYKYNIIVNFASLYNKIQGKHLPNIIEMEYESDNKVQNGLDVECTEGKYKVNQMTIEENIKLSKGNNLRGYDSAASKYLNKGLNKLKRVFKNILGNNDDKDMDKDEIIDKDENDNGIKSIAVILEKEIDEMKTEMNDIKKEKKTIESVCVKIGINNFYEFYEYYECYNIMNILRITTHYSIITTYLNHAYLNP